MTPETGGDRKPVPDNWERGDSYERYVGRWSRRIAPRFLSWLNLPAGRRWLDVGCGTGALSAAILENCAPAGVTGVEPSAGFLAVAQAHLAGRAGFARGAAEALPLASASFDGVVSGLVLNFVPDLPAALAGMRRVAARRGVVAAYLWDYAEKMEFMRIFWDAAAELDPLAAELDEGARFAISRPGALKDVFLAAGLEQVELTPIDIPTPFDNFADFWQPFLGGQGSAPSYVMSLDEESRVRLRERLREILPAQPDGSIHLTARAWAARGSVL